MAEVECKVGDWTASAIQEAYHHRKKELCEAEREIKRRQAEVTKAEKARDNLANAVRILATDAIYLGITLE